MAEQQSYAQEAVIYLVSENMKRVLALCSFLVVLVSCNSTYEADRQFLASQEV